MNNVDDPIPIVPGRFLGFQHPETELHIVSDDTYEVVACPGNDDATDAECTISSVPNIAESNIPGVTSPLVFQTLPQPGIPTNFAAGDFLLFTGFNPLKYAMPMRHIVEIWQETHNSPSISSLNSSSTELARRFSPLPLETQMGNMLVPAAMIIRRTLS